MTEIFKLIMLGAIAGFTIYLGLPIARIKGVSAKFKGMLNSAATGILLFLLVEILGDAFEDVSPAVVNAATGNGAISIAITHSALLVAGLAIGLLGLVWFEKKFIKSQKYNNQFPDKIAKKISLIIAAGIGFHNFSEGLAIGQSYASGAYSFALLLVIGFGLHNATEGFGIAAPLSGFKPDWKFLALLGLIGGGPTFLGSIIGSFWVSEAISVFFLSIAAGAIIYVIKELWFHGRIHGDGLDIMSAFILGFLIGFGTDLVIKVAVGA